MKWEIISSHSSRKTWITHAIRKGIPLNVVLGICWLKRMDTILRYTDKFGPVNGYSKLLEEYD